MFIYVCEYLHVCLHVYICVCTYVRMYVYTHICIYVHRCVCIFVCMYVCVYVRIYVYIPRHQEFKSRAEDSEVPASNLVPRRTVVASHLPTTLCSVTGAESAAFESRTTPRRSRPLPEKSSTTHDHECLPVVIGCAASAEYLS